ncbi:MAG: ATP-binding protein [Paludibacteraceae bacterium]|nr:ATP-binding protein [Paludibacteraceae bacterium]
MKSIKIKINRLGRIKDSEIEIKPLMFFSGESGMGKSYLALLCHYFYEVLLDRERINKFFIEKNLDFNSFIESSDDRQLAFSVNKADFEAWLAKDAISYIRYMINNDSLDADIQVQIPEDFDSQMNCTFENEQYELNNQVHNAVKLKLPSLTFRVEKVTIALNEESPFAFFFRCYLLDEIFGDYKALERTFVLPPSRGSLMTEQMTPVSGLYRKFEKDKYYWTRAKSQEVHNDPEIAGYIKNILEGSISIKEDKYVYSLNSGKQTNTVDMPLSAAASSIRELAPIEMIVENSNIDKISVLFEEPEAHLHPEKQRMMADLICYLSVIGAHLQITTHSDYLVHRFNEILRTSNYKVQGVDVSSLLEKLGVPNRALVEASNVGAYYLRRESDNSSKIIKQEIDNGIPDDSFQKADKYACDNRQFLDEMENEALEND